MRPIEDGGAPLVHWLVPGEFPDLKSLAQSNLASIRLRLGMAAPALVTVGVNVSVGDRILGYPLLIIIGKIGANDLESRSELWIKQIKRLKRTTKVSVALDYTDNHLEFNSSMTKFYNDILPLVDYYICPTQYLSDSLNKQQYRPTFFVEDGIENECISPNERETNDRLRVLWFGHESNLQYLLELLDSSDAPEYFPDLMIVSGPRTRKVLSSFSPKKHLQSKISYTLWSSEALIQISRTCHLCVIPSNPLDPKKAGASSNRLITSLALGLPTAADHIESYKKFKDFFVDIRSPQFEVLLRDPSQFHQMVLDAQEKIVPNFYAVNIGKQWISALRFMFSGAWLR
jgi:hypothetical protein